MLGHRIHINRVMVRVLQDRSHAPSVVGVVQVIQIASARVHGLCHLRHALYPALLYEGLTAPTVRLDHM